MSNLIEISIGARPWLPSENAEAVAEFDRYDIPTCGLVRQDGKLFVFDCAEGHLMEGNVWIYAYVSDDEAGDLEGAAGEEFIELLESIFRSRSIMGVLAIDGRVRSGTIVHKRDIDDKGLGRALLDELQKGRGVAGAAASALSKLVCV